VSYIDAGYAIVLGLLACYAASLGRRRRRLEMAARRLEQATGSRSPANGR
jgi:hypothetical protein